MIEFQVEGMSCQHCVATITKAVQAYDASAHVRVDLPRKRVYVESTHPIAQLKAAISDAGYTITHTTPTQ